MLLINVVILSSVVIRVWTRVRRDRESEDGWLALGEEDGGWLSRFSEALRGSRPEDDATGWDPTSGDRLDGP